jgi:hypothetical protein
MEKHMQIDKMKLRAEIKRVEAARKTGQEPPYPHKQPIAAHQAWRREIQRLSASGVTGLYALMAHSRGRLHITKEWVPTCDATGGLKLVTRDLAHQEGLVQGLVEEFAAVPEPVQASL